MTELVSVIEMDLYIDAAERLLSEEERHAVIDVIASDPQAGVVVPGTGGLRKMRIPLRGRGKRGGARVIYWFHSGKHPAVLLFVFAKNEAQDLSPERRRLLSRITAGLVEDFGVGK
jgi:hypothetical protein